MPRLLILPHETDATICLPEGTLPAFYMEDFSVLGLRVGNMEAAVQLLEKHSVDILKKPAYSELSLENKDQIPHIVHMLNENDVSCVLADIVEQVYQG